MRSRYLLALVVVGALACGKSKKPPVPVAVSPPAVTPATAVKEEAKVEKPVTEWVYSSAGKRDPFRSYLADVEAAGKAIVTRCSTALGRFEVDQLKLVAVITGLDDPIAMVEGPNGVGYSLRRGVCVGRNGGVVVAVRTGEVAVSEWIVKADGTRDKTTTTLQLPKQAPSLIEE